MMTSQDQSHPCETPGCKRTVMYDDEPHCFVHSPDEGSYVAGYSYRQTHRSNYRCVSGDDHDFFYNIDTDQMEECTVCGLPYSEWTREET